MKQNRMILSFSAHTRLVKKIAMRLKNFLNLLKLMESNMMK